jgi:Uma2 family endonuclease
MAVRHMTAEELCRYSNEPYRQELVEGILHEMEPTGGEHGIVAAQVIALLLMHVKEHDLGTVFATEVGFHLASDPDTVRAPDAAFVAKARAEAVRPSPGFWPGPPDLAVEVVSPSDRHTEVEGKALHWLAAGTKAVVVLDPPRRSATVYRARDDIRALEDGDTLELGDVVTGFAPLVGDLFG